MTSAYQIGAARGLEPASAAIFAAACAFAAARLWPGGGTPSLAVAILTVTLAYPASLAILRRLASHAPLAIPAFDPAPIETTADELLLEDALEPLDPDSRVVRLFAQPRSGGARAPVSRSDDTEAMLRALAELRRKFR